MDRNMCDMAPKNYTIEIIIFVTLCMELMVIKIHISLNKDNGMHIP